MRTLRQLLVQRRASGPAISAGMLTRTQKWGVRGYDWPEAATHVSWYTVSLVLISGAYAQDRSAQIYADYSHLL